MKCPTCIISDLCRPDIHPDNDECKMFWRRLAGMVQAGPPDGLDKRRRELDKIDKDIDKEQE